MPGKSAATFASLRRGVLPIFPITSCEFRTPILQLVIHLTRLLIRTGAIGDFILSLPALESLRADYTEVWCAGQNVPLARFADSAQSIVASGLDRLGLLPAQEVVDRLRTFDSVISWYGTNRPEFREVIAELGLPFQLLPALPTGAGH